jgi:lysophospholipase L1-like esterase
MIQHDIRTGLFGLLLAATTAVTWCADTPLASQATVAPFAKAPAIDGTLTPGEWDGALGTGMMGNWSTGELEPRQATARLGWYKDRLYLLVVSAVPPTFVPGTALPRDTEAVLTTNPTLECWLDPNRATRASGTGDLSYYQLLLDSAGNIIDACRDGRGVPDDRWDGRWTTAIKVDPQTGQLITEASLPFADLGMTGKVDGRTLGLLFGYNFMAPFTQLQWMPMGNSSVGFDNPPIFPTIRLASQTPTVQVVGLGERLLQGELDAQLTLTNPGRACAVRLLSTLSAPGAAPVREETVVELPARGRVPFRVRPGVKQAVGVLHQWQLTVTSADGKEIFFADRRCWKPSAAPVAAKWHLAPGASIPADASQCLDVFNHAVQACPPNPALLENTRTALAKEQCERAILHLGDTARLQRVLAKAQRGEPVTVGAIGGSVTHGAGGTNSLMHGYAGLFANWWRVTFPTSKLTFVNAAIGGTGSLFGTHRLERDLLCYQPELVVVEFSINDTDTELLGQTYEGVMRQLLRKAWAPAVISFTVWGGKGHLGNPSTWHEKVARHYNLPMVSARVAVSPEMLSGQLKFEEFMADVIHPNDRGHRALAATLIHYLDKVRTLPVGAQTETPLPAPLLTDRFEQASIVPAWQLSVTKAQNYTRHLGKWCGGFKDSEFAFQFTGAGAVTIGFERSSVRQMGQAEVRVDGGAPVLLDAYWNLSFSLEQYTEVAANLPYGVHTVTLRMLPSPTNPWKPWTEKFDGFVLKHVLFASAP